MSLPVACGTAPVSFCPSTTLPPLNRDGKLTLNQPPQVEHKIQSADGPLELALSKVPKMLGVLRHGWAPGAFVVSFKLETDERILLKKVGRGFWVACGLVGWGFGW